jgi:hypothetical protein
LATRPASASTPVPSSDGWLAGSSSWGARAGRLEQLGGAFDPVQGARIHELAAEALTMAGEANGFGRLPAGLAQRDVQTIAEALTEAYLEGAEASHDPERLQSLQALAARSIARLAWLRSLSA